MYETLRSREIPLEYTIGYVLGNPLPETQGHPSQDTIRSLLQWSRFGSVCESKSVQHDGRPQRSLEVFKRLTGMDDLVCQILLNPDEKHVAGLFIIINR